MKKHLLLVISFSFLSFCAFAQLTRTNPQLFTSPIAISQVVKTGNEEIIKTKGSYLKTPSSFPSYGDTVGFTWYDFQTNGGMQNRIHQDNLGNIQVVWTKSLDTINDPSNIYRGIGYNYFDANTQTWIPGDSNNTAYGIAEKKVGWPSIAPIDGNNEAILAHTDRLYTSTKGQSGVTATNIGGGVLHQATGVTFYHTAAEGNTIYTCYNNTPKFYFGKSDDLGLSWSISDIALDSVCGTPLRPLAAESYDLDAKGDTVAVIVGGHSAFIGNVPNNVVLYLSYDRGNTWSCQTIHIFDTINAVQDPSGGYKVQTPYSDARVLIGSDGRIHCTGSVIAALTDRGTLNSTSWYPLTRGIWYWNSDMSDNFDLNDSLDYSKHLLVDSIPDLTTMGNYPSSANEMGNYETGIYSHPSISQDYNGNLYIVFSGVCAGSDINLYDNKYKRDLFIMRSLVGGKEWSSVINMAALLFANDVTDGSSGEEVYPATPKRFEFELPILFQYDKWAGSTLIDNQAILEENKMAVLIISPNSTVGFIDENPLLSAILYPNPAKGSVNLSFESDASGEVQVNVANMIGQSLLMKSVEVRRGENTIQLDVRNLSEGIYLVTLGSGKNKITQKLVIE